jgi:hypothetical protein
MPFWVTHTEFAKRTPRARIRVADAPIRQSVQVVSPAFSSQAQWLHRTPPRRGLPIERTYAMLNASTTRVK